MSSIDAPSRTGPPAPPRHRVGGFTIMEMMVVVVVLAILGAMLIPRFSGTAAREFRQVVEQTADLMTMYAQREQLQQQPVGLSYDRERHALVLEVQDRDLDAKVATAAWRRDTFVSPVNIPEWVEIVEITADGEPVYIDEWPLATTPSEPRPTISITFEARDEDLAATITLAAHAIVPVHSGMPGVSPDIFEPVDLDGAGRSREEW